CDNGPVGDPSPAAHPVEDTTVGEPTELSRYFLLDSRNGVTVLNFVDIQISPDAKDLLYSLVENQGHKQLLLNFSNIESLTTLNLGVLANLQKKVDAIGGQLKFCCLNPDLLRLFRMTKFDQIFEIYDTQEDALRAF
ncbi:MAG TPA: STAS domain-containing protein, partial [Isosphaeraceae bacterium]|nr:STAS domain-containing protein [Isosphaeraceae bacterium]